MRHALIAAFCALLLTGCAAGTMTTEQARQIDEGMTADEVVAVAGKPININVSKTQGHRRDQWVYQSTRSRYQRVYVYFDNGFVSGVQY